VSSSPMCLEEACLADGMQLEFLIVTRPMFVEALQPFIDWKSQNGFRVGMVTVEWLEANNEGRHLAEKIKVGLHDLRRRTGLKYVLLVGDTVVQRHYGQGQYDLEATTTNLLNSYNLSRAYNVPTGFYQRLITDPASVVLPSDAYYVEDKDWDPENTGLNPRPDNIETGDGKLNADLYLGRWPVQTIQDLDTVIQKTMAFTPTQSLFAAADKSLWGSSNCYAWPPDPGLEMACYQDLFNVWQKKAFNDPAQRLPVERMLVNLNNTTQATQFKEKILSNDVAMVLNFHGLLDCLGIRGSECVSAAEFQFQNRFTLLEIQACAVGDITNPSRSFMESMLIAESGPTLVTSSPTPVLFMNDLKNGKSAGEAFWGSASAWVYWPNLMVLLGDPSLPVFVPPGK